MIDRSKKITARFYALASGRRPVREWLLGLRVTTAESSDATSKRSNSAGLSGCPIAARLATDCWEVRSDLPGGRIVRVIFCIAGGEMVLLHGFEKKTQKTPPQDIELALRRKRDIDR